MGNSVTASGGKKQPHILMAKYQKDAERSEGQVWSYAASIVRKGLFLPNFVPDVCYAQEVMGELGRVIMKNEGGGPAEGGTSSIPRPKFWVREER